MATARWGRLRGAVTGSDTATLPAILGLHLGLLFKFTVRAVAAQPQCGSGMCESPLSTIQSAPSIADIPCYSPGQTAVIFCNAGFRESGDRYTATCGEGGVWMHGGVCRIDLFSILVACSASLVAILVFFVVVLCMCQFCFLDKWSRQPVSKADKKAKKNNKKKPKTDPEAANGHPTSHTITDPGHHDYQMDDTEDDFTDDEDDILPSKAAARAVHHDEHVYQNQEF